MTTKTRLKPGQKVWVRNNADGTWNEGTYVGTSNGVCDLKDCAFVWCHRSDIATAKPGLYIQTTTCGEHTLHGPYKDESERLEAAKELYSGETGEFSQETDDIERYEGTPAHGSTSPFSNGELMSDEE